MVYSEHGMDIIMHYFKKKKHERSALFVCCSDFHSSAELIGSIKIDGTVVLQALEYTSTASLTEKCSCGAYIINVWKTHTHTYRAFAHLHHTLKSVKINAN